MSKKILHIDDDALIRDAVTNQFVTEDGIYLRSASGESEAEILLKTEDFDLILLDIHLEDGKSANGIELLKRYRKTFPFIPVIIYSSDINALKKCMQLGASDFIVKSTQLKELPLRVIHFLKTNSYSMPESLPYAGKFMNEINNRIAKIVRSSIRNVLVYGESGTGKESIVDIMQNHLPQNTPVVRVNCAAIAPNLIESELFGHAKGAFTGATKDRRGFFESANHGWLFLDEVTCLPLTAQASLLRAIENQEVTRVGETQVRSINVKVIAATNENIPEKIDAEKFRLDLWQRLNETTIELLPLRQRKKDIPSIIESICQNEEGGPYQMSNECLDILLAQSWSKGNVRELRNCIRAMTAYHVNRLLVPAGIPDWIWGENTSEDPEDDEIQTSGIKLNLDIQRDTSFERATDKLLISMIEEISKGPGAHSIRRMARHLQMPKSTLANKLKKAIDRGVVTESELKKIWPK